jgi:hypothetical protein
MAQTNNQSGEFNPEDLGKVEFWQNLGIEPIVINSEKDFSKVSERIQQEVKNLQQKKEGN